MNRNMRVPTRTAPSVDEVGNQRPAPKQIKKKPPPRPPPPNFSKIKSKSAWNLNNQFESLSLIDLTPPESPKPFSTSRSSGLGGSVSSSFSSSTSSLASSKRSFEYDSGSFEQWGINSKAATPSTFYVNSGQSNIPTPTIIRPQNTKRSLAVKPREEVTQRSSSPPMPTVPPPSPPQELTDHTPAYGIALYDYDGAQSGDLSFKVNDVIFLLRRVNKDWLYGRIEDREGLFPNNYISTQVALPDEDRLVTALYEFTPQAVGDLWLKPGQIVHVTGRVSADWLIGECNGCTGQFPANFVDRIPSTI